MRYMGGKAQIAKQLVSAILDDGAPRERWFEPFVGGANVTEHAASLFGSVVGSDQHPDLILMWSAVVDGWLPPEFVSREEYNALRHAEPSALRGFAGFGASFGGKWFGGYAVSQVDAKHKYAEECRASYHVVSRQARVFREHRVRFVPGGFDEYEPPPGTTVYCDPPYRGTTGYSVGELDHAAFYAEIGGWASKGCAVYVSEYSEPIGVPFRTVWERTRRSTLRSSDNTEDRVERLFRILGSPYSPTHPQQ